MGEEIGAWAWGLVVVVVVNIGWVGDLGLRVAVLGAVGVDRMLGVGVFRTAAVRGVFETGRLRPLSPCWERGVVDGNGVVKVATLLGLMVANFFIFL